MVPRSVQSHPGLIQYLLTNVKVSLRSREEVEVHNEGATSQSEYKLKNPLLTHPRFKKMCVSTDCAGFISPFQSSSYLVKMHTQQKRSRFTLQISKTFLNSYFVKSPKVHYDLGSSK